ncbi:MAG: hypothetical protein JWO89_2213 [Verrucomicrobiaceae bacterium]|nr:hypothetical protein [Verrucomicrobiaceae bacterium]
MKKSALSATADKTSEALATIGRSVDATNANTEEDIRGRAYSLYLAEGRPEGRALEHWLAAEADCNASLKNGEAPGSGEGEAAELQSFTPVKKTTAARPRSRKQAVA